MDRFTGRAALKPLHDADDVASALRGLWVSPAVSVIENVPERIIGLLKARRGDVKAPPLGQFHARRGEVKLDAAFMRMPDPKDVPLVWFKPRESQGLKGVYGFALLSLAGVIFSCERQDTGAVAPLVGCGVDQGFGVRRVAPQDFGQWVTSDHDHPPVSVTL
jgi:hypothetical protein